uniref:MYND-type domain-containing protein n=1 Tax=Arcella intermedia TaxID=1963864 RepID=A0A6B2KZK4_9EUKA
MERGGVEFRRRVHFLRHTMDSKSEKVALDWKQKGNTAYSNKNLDSALYYYNRAICCSPAGSENISLSYANKGACFVELKEPRLAIVECSNAIKTGYPNPKKYKILERRAKQYVLLEEYELALKDFNEALGFGNIIPLKERNAILQEIKRINNLPRPTTASTSTTLLTATSGSEETKDCLSSHRIKLQKTTNFGNHVVSTGTIPYGIKIIHSEKPFAKALFTDFNDKKCSTCFSDLNSIFPCSNCTNTAYCSEICREMDSKLHQFECGKLLYCVAPIELILSLRIIKNKELSEDYPLFSDFNSRYSAIFNLQDHLKNYPNKQIIKYCVDSIIAEQYLNDPLFTASKIMKHLLQIQTNAFAVSKIYIPIFQKSDNLEDYSQLRVGLAVYPCGSYFNHSCKPNTCINFGKYLELSVIATEQILPNDQIFINYGPDHIRIKDSDRRKKILKQKYFFDCLCQKCSERVEIINLDTVQELFNTALKLENTSLAKALEIYNRALKTCPPNDLLAAKIHDRLSFLFSQRNNYTEAKLHTLKSIKILETIFGFHSIEIGIEYLKLAKISYITSNQPDPTTTTYLKKAQNILNTLCEPENPLLLELNTFTKQTQPTNPT